MFFPRKAVAATLAAGLTLTGLATNLRAAPAPPPPPAQTYSDLADLADSAPLVLRAEIRSVAVVEPARAQDVRKGWARLYIQARPLAMLLGDVPGAASAGESLSYLADVPVDARGKPPALKKKDVILFAREVPGNPGELQLVAPDAQLEWDPALEARVRSILAELASPGGPVRISSVRLAMYVPGTLAGEGETQIFLATVSGEPASISVEHHPGQPTSWSASFSEVVDTSGKPPAHDTLPWYRLACSLPPVLPAGSNVSDGDDNRAQAAADYAKVLADLGPCRRNRQ